MSYVKAAVETVQRLLAEDGRELKTGKNLADPLTKLMPYTKKQGLLGQVLYDHSMSICT